MNSVEKKGLTLQDFINNPEYNNMVSKEIFNLSSEKCQEIKTLIDKIKINEFDNTKQQGDAFERIIAVIFSADYSNVFKVLKGIRTTSNEIDVVVSLQDNGISLNVDKILGINGKEIIIECKNYEKKIDVTWVGKFAHLMESHNVNFGVIFSKKELTGIKKGKLTWKDSAGLTKKNYLKNNKIILNITLEDIENIIHKNINFSELLSKKREELQFDTYLKFEVHENSNLNLKN